MAATAGGLGITNLSSQEPETLPFGAVGYALVGIFSLAFMNIQPVQSLVISIVA